MLIQSEPMREAVKMTESHKASRVVSEKGESRTMRGSRTTTMTAQTRAQKLREKQTRPQPFPSGQSPRTCVTGGLVYGPILSFFPFVCHS